MPVRGRKPKDPAVRRNKVPPRHEWTEVPNIPFEGRALPPWPPVFRITGQKTPIFMDNWPEPTQAWWEAISTMPHAARWDEAEWQFAGATALLVAAFHLGELRYGYEIRSREKIMGTTSDSRRDLRIRYVDPDSYIESDPADTASVTAMADYQRMVDGQG